MGYGSTSRGTLRHLSTDSAFCNAYSSCGNPIASHFACSSSTSSSSSTPPHPSSPPSPPLSPTASNPASPLSTPPFENFNPQEPTTSCHLAKSRCLSASSSGPRYAKLAALSKASPKHAAARLLSISRCFIQRSRSY
ncbi:unnamed protein product, partial [Closterium sp. NIES-54]